MGIHQIQVRYDATADRLLVQLRTTSAEHYAVWLTRRLLSRLYPPFRQAVAQASMALTTPHALPVPEARQMLTQAALQRPLPHTQFEQPFDTTGARHPLGTEPLLADAADLRPDAQGQLALTLRETQGRRLDMVLTAELSTALLRLLDQALAAAEWGLPQLQPPAAETGSPAPAPLFS